VHHGLQGRPIHTLPLGQPGEGRYDALGMARHRAQQYLHDRHTLALAQRADQAPVEDGQAALIRVEEVARVRIAMKQGMTGLREHGLSNQGFNHQLRQPALIAPGI
jgi:hypothetical protein